MATSPPVAGATPVALAVVLPSYNEALNLPPLIRRLRDALEPRFPTWEVVVVDDGSTDRTAEVAESLGQTYPVRVLRHATNRGLDGALTTGLVHATPRADVVVTMDADDTHDPALIGSMVDRLDQGFDIVIASRFQPGAAEIGVPRHRRLLSHSVSHVMRVIGNVSGARDYSCGFRAYRSELLKAMLDTYGADRLISGSGFACMVDLLLKSKQMGARVAEVPLVLQYDRKGGESKMQIGRTIRRYGSVVWADRLRTLRGTKDATVVSDSGAS